MLTLLSLGYVYTKNHYLCWVNRLAQKGGGKVWITSLNSHFPHQKPQPKMLKRKKAEPKTPHFLSLNQNVVAWSQEQKCGLKYVISTQLTKAKQLSSLSDCMRLLWVLLLNTFSIQTYWYSWWTQKVTYWPLKVGTPILLFFLVFKHIIFIHWCSAVTVIALTLYKNAFTISGTFLMLYCYWRCTKQRISRCGATNRNN